MAAMGKILRMPKSGCIRIMSCAAILGRQWSLEISCTFESLAVAWPYDDNEEGNSIVTRQQLSLAWQVIWTARIPKAHSNAVLESPGSVFGLIWSTLMQTSAFYSSSWICGTANLLTYSFDLRVAALRMYIKLKDLGNSLSCQAQSFLCQGRDARGYKCSYCSSRQHPFADKGLSTTGSTHQFCPYSLEEV